MLKMKKFPVKIDLSIFFEDERKYVIILVDPQWKNVEYLQRRVEEIFDVRPVRFLTTDNLFIPPQESIEVVEFTESLKAFIPKHALEESRRRSRQLKLETPANPINVEESVEKNLVKKRKYHTLPTDVLGSSTPNKTKKSKRIPREVDHSPVNTVEPISNESQEITSTNEQVSILKASEDLQHNKSVAKESICDSVRSFSNNVNKQSITFNDSEEKSVSKRKHKRPHKESSILPMDFDQEIAEQTVTLRPEVPSSTFLNHSKSSNKSSHIYFEESTLVETTTKEQQNKSINKSITKGKSNTTKVLFRCKLNDAEFEKTLVFPLKYINNNSEHRKSIIKIQENILLQPANTDSLNNAPALNESESQLDENVLPRISNATGDQESETEDGIGNVTENEDNFASPKNEIVKKIEGKSSSTREERTKNADNITNGLNDSNCMNDTTSDIENEKQTGKINEHSKCESQIEEEEVTITSKSKNSKAGKENNVTNHSQVELSNLECNLDEAVQEEIVSTNDKMKQTDVTESNFANISEMSNRSLLMHESSVIDLDDDDEVVIDLSDADDQHQSLATSRIDKLSETLNNSISTMNIDEMLSFCIPLTGTPELGDVIIFKFNRRVSGAKIDESQFIACRCEHINKRTKALKLAVINDSLENAVIPQKYKYSVDDSFETRFMNIKFTEMIDPKVLKLSS